MPDDLSRRVTFPVHPAAEAFPLLSQDELQELADRIKRNGLRHTIKLDHTGTILVDGRNREAACKIAGVAPRYERLPEDEDLVAYIYDENATRRNITAGQRALARARLFPEAKVGRPKKGSLSEPLINKAQLSEAREIVRYDDLFELGRDGKMKFDHALRLARERTRLQENSTHYFGRLSSEAPDLATLVREEQLNLQEAWAAFEKRQADAAEAERHKRETYLRIGEAVYRGAIALNNAEFIAGMRERVRDPAFRMALLERLHISGEPADLQPGIDALVSILEEAVQ